MTEYIISNIEKLIQTDAGLRGICSNVENNLLTYTKNHLLQSAKVIQKNAGCTIGIITGFYIPDGNPAAPETDGPPGSLALARGLNSLGYKVILISDSPCIQALKAGKKLFAENMAHVDIVEFPFKLSPVNHIVKLTKPFWERKRLNEFIHEFFDQYPSLKFLISIERVGPAYSKKQIIEKNMNEAMLDKFKKLGPGALQGQCLNMKAQPVSRYSADLFRLFEYIKLNNLNITTIGIGDGGNEIGMGNIPWQVIQENISGGTGGKIACYIATDYTIVAGVSNWGGYALLAALSILKDEPDAFLGNVTETCETKLIQYYTEHKIAVDGVRKYPDLSVDGIEWNVHLSVIGILRHFLSK